MAKDNAVRDQKVFVRLGSVMELQEQYLRTCDDASKATQGGTYGSALARKAAYENVIKMLDLPIELVHRV